MHDQINDNFKVNWAILWVYNRITTRMVLHCWPAHSATIALYYNGQKQLAIYRRMDQGRDGLVKKDQLIMEKDRNNRQEWRKEVKNTRKQDNCLFYAVHRRTDRHRLVVEDKDCRSVCTSSLSSSPNCFKDASTHFLSHACQVWQLLSHQV